LTEPRLSWVITLKTAAQSEEISRIFEFVEDIAEVAITPDDTANTKVEEKTPQDIIREHTPPVQIAFAAPHNDRSFGTNPEKPDNVVKLAAPATIRVNLDRVDKLINLIGELVIMEASLTDAFSKINSDTSDDAATCLDRMRQLAGEIQEVVMAIRAQPLRPVFQRMERILREANEATGKKSRLIMIGDSTEVDKTIIERLVDPLTHMIRNSVDHGLEETSQRIAAGKPAEGTITLSAAHRSGRVLIEVSDDGGGINRPKVHEIAEMKGLIPANATLSTAEIDNLLFMPGFSSKSEVSELSGRGVGLDVVRREIQSLGGRVSITSTEGLGTTFTIALPLTLAVLEGMLLKFGTHTMVMPISAIVETLVADRATVHVIGSTGRVVVNRGVLVPLIQLCDVFGNTSGDPGIDATTANGVFIIVETETGQRAALAVDEILDQRQIVIKSLEDNYRQVPGISAATILGNGCVALIIDPEEVVRAASPVISSSGFMFKG
jgi:two-component system chemotaxis sensor kinase CheA